MTNEKAIKILKRKMDGSVDTSYEWAETVRIAIDALRAQPETHEERTETHACDCISRQAAIDALDNLDYMPGEWSVRGLSLCKDAIKALPPEQPEVLACGEGELIAQPEIIRCNDCKHWTQTTGNMCGFGLGDCDYINAKLVNCNGFCYWAERRTDE